MISEGFLYEVKGTFYELVHCGQKRLFYAFNFELKIRYGAQNVIGIKW